MSEPISTVQSELFDLRPDSPEKPKRDDIYIVMAYRQPGKYWKIWPQQILSHEKAESIAQEFAPGWVHRQIIKIPGTKEA